MRDPIRTLSEWLSGLPWRRRFIRAIRKRSEIVWQLDREMLAAAGEGDAEQVRRLLWRGGMPLARGDDGATLIHAAALSDSLETLEVVLDEWGHVEARDEYGATPLHYAANAGAVATAVGLLEAGAAVDSTDEDGRTPLHYAAFSGEIEVARMLLASGADVVAQTAEGCRDTPLHVAASLNQGDFIEALLGIGGLAGLCNGVGDTLADYAAGHGHHELAATLGRVGVASERRG